jgi:DNA polymerase I-like protein with 3'-5' exonuclease and polymerase domains
VPSDTERRRTLLIRDIDQLRDLLRPIREGKVDLAAVDTETTEVTGGRFTPWGTTSRTAGFCVSYDLDGREVDLYAPIRHKAYDWRRRPDLIQNDKRRGAWWMDQLLTVERVRPFGHPDGPGFMPGADPNLPMDLTVELMQETLAAPTCRWVLHNGPFDFKMFQADGIEPPFDRYEDTQILSVQTDERKLDVWVEATFGPDGEEDDGGHWAHQGHALKHLGEHYLGVPPEAEELLEEAKHVLGAPSKLDDYSMLPLITVVAPYGWGDTRLTLPLFQLMMQRDAARDPKVLDLYRKHLREVRVSIGMERRGIRVNVPSIAPAVARQKEKVKAIQADVARIAGEALPMNNGPALAEKLYDQLGVPVYRGPDGKPIRNTKKATLKTIRARVAAGKDRCAGKLNEDATVELLDAIGSFRREDKMLSAFYAPLEGFTSDGVIHFVLKPWAARTTRFSSEAPNIQQTPNPIEGKEDECVRAHFIPRDGHGFLFCDYSQIELRIAAHYSRMVPEHFEYQFYWGCTMGKRGSCKGKDKDGHGPGVIHYGWRSDVSSRPAELRLYEGFWADDGTPGKGFDPHQVMADAARRPRKIAKAANFALLYGAFPKKIAETLDIPIEEAEHLFKSFWEVAYPELDRVKTFVGERLRQGGKNLPWARQPFIRTLHGGRIHLAGAHKGLNYLVQRSAREVLLNAHDALPEMLERERIPYQLLAPIHDEIVFEYPLDSLDQGAVRKIARCMAEAGAACKVPMVVEPEISTTTWAHKEELPPGWGWHGVAEALKRGEVAA